MIQARRLFRQYHQHILLFLYRDPLPLRHDATHRQLSQYYSENSCSLLTALSFFHIFLNTLLLCHARNKSCVPHYLEHLS
ncbi:hypothetical protein OMAG_002769 [Candidatus Omnitrophus magneticus]|uniref:Uncharacterized protein n=1 Tax=Candidatus Omnitrophus magneticus TaxID=1609969 RepID=A0A0F0CJ87_9BACT|nr:hypothetical protein OMAG_002769 [Candidatus Omnitrophus magneticus]